MRTRIGLLAMLLAMGFVSCSKSNLNDEKSSGSTGSNRLKSTVSSDGTSGSFTALSYNVAGLPQALSSAANRELYTPIIGQKVSNYDIVNVQEDFNYHAALYASDTHTYRTATSGGAGIGDGMNTMSVFPFSEDLIRNKWSSCNGTDCLTPKGFTWNRIRLAEGVYIDVYNVHTNAGSTTADYTARCANVNELVSYINTNSSGNAIMVFGDFNCRYTRAEDNIRNMITGLSTSDPWIGLIKGNVYPTQGADALVCDDIANILTSFDCEVVDKMFYRGNAHINLTATAYTLEDAFFRYTDGAALSDHRPMYTKFQWSLASTRKMSDQFGGPHGTGYNDVNSLPTSPIVSKIGLRAGSRVDQVNLTLSNGTTLTHGGTGGTANSLSLNSGEYVKSVYLCSGKKDGETRIFYVKFTTSSGRTVSGGTTTSTNVTYTAPTGWQIVGFHGRAGSENDKLGVIYAPVQ